MPVIREIQVQTGGAPAVYALGAQAEHVRFADGQSLPEALAAAVPQDCTDEEIDRLIADIFQ